MGMMISPEVLRRYPLFAGLDDTMIKKIAMAGEKTIAKKGDWLFREGEVANSLFIILKGKVEIKVSLGKEDMYQVGVSGLREGELFGWSSLVEPYKYQLGAVTKTSCELAKFDGVRLCEIFAHNPAVGYKMMSRIMQIIGGRLIHLRIRFISLIEGGRWEQLASQKLIYTSVGGRLRPINRSLPNV